MYVAASMVTDRHTHRHLTLVHAQRVKNGKRDISRILWHFKFMITEDAKSSHIEFKQLSVKDLYLLFKYEIVP